MGKRGPKKGNGGRPRKTNPAVNPITQLQRLRKRELRARKSGQLEKAQQIQNEIENLTNELKKQKNDPCAHVHTTSFMHDLEPDYFDDIPTESEYKHEITNMEKIKTSETKK